MTAVTALKIIRKLNDTGVLGIPARLFGGPVPVEVPLHVPIEGMRLRPAITHPDDLPPHEATSIR